MIFWQRNLFLLLILLAGHVVSAEQASIIVGRMAAMPDESVLLPISVTTDSLIGAVQVTLEYDSTQLHFEDAASASSLEDFSLLFNRDLPFPPASSDMNTNVLCQLYSGTGSFRGNQRKILLLSFRVKALAGDTAHVALDALPAHTSLATIALTNISSESLTLQNGWLYVSSEPMPRIRASTDYLDFGDISLFDSQIQTIQISNTGTADLSLQEVKIAGRDSIDFFQNMPERSIVPPDSAVQMMISFVPMAPGEKKAEIEILSNDPMNPMTRVVLHGNVIAIPDPDIELEKTRYDFGVVVVDSTTEQMITIRNLGVTPLSIDSLGIDGAKAFSIADASMPIQMAQNDSSQISMRFTPRSAGDFEADLFIYSNDPDENVLVVRLAGKAVDSGTPAINFFPAHLGFGKIALGYCTKFQIVVSNSGTVNLELSTIALKENLDDFTIDISDSMNTLVPNGSKSFFIYFCPTIIGNRTDTLVIRSNDPLNPEIDIPLSGEGVAEASARISVDKNRVDFGNVHQGKSKTDSIIVTNTGSADLTLDNIIIESDDVNNFIIQDLTSPIPIMPNGRYPILITCQPQTIGVLSSILKIKSNSVVDSSLSVILSGTGISLPADSSESYAFPNPFNPLQKSVSILLPESLLDTNKLKIVDSHGDLVQEIEIQNAKNSIVMWDGRNRYGDVVVNGVYFYILELLDKEKFIGKIAVLR